MVWVRRRLPGRNRLGLHLGRAMCGEGARRFCLRLHKSRLGQHSCPVIHEPHVGWDEGDLQLCCEEAVCRLLFCLMHLLPLHKWGWQVFAH